MGDDYAKARVARCRRKRVGGSRKEKMAATEGAREYLSERLANRPSGGGELAGEKSHPKNPV